MSYNNSEFTTLKSMSVMVITLILTACGGGGGQATDPTIQATPVAFVKRAVNPSAGNARYNLFDPSFYDVNFPAELIIKENAVLNAGEIVISPALLSDPALHNRTWDVKDLEFSDDGSKLLFAAHLQPDPADATDRQTWDIYEYNLTSGVLRRVLAFSGSSAILALQGDEVSPSYLPDGQIIYASNYNKESTTSTIKPENEIAGNGPAFNLSVMSLDGLQYQQVSFGTSHDLYPTVLRTGPFNGKVVFSRWDTNYDGSGNRNHGMYLYMMDPDGRGVEKLYGRNSRATGTTNDTIQFTKPRQMSDGRILSLIRRTSGTFNGGAIAAINVNGYIDNTISIVGQSGTGPAQTDVSGTFASTRSGITNTGKFNSVYPLLDSNNALVSYSSCIVTVVEGTATVPHSCDPSLSNPTDAPQYGIYMFNMSTQASTPVKLPDKTGFYNYTDVAISQQRTTPAFITLSTNTTLDGTMHFRKVRPVTGPASMATFVRFYKHVYLPDATLIDPKTFGVNSSRSLRELIGYAPIAGDGSVRVRLPANVPLSMQLVNDNHEDLGVAHSAWFSVRSGEVKTCNGCHEGTAAHGRRDAETQANLPTTLAENRSGMDLIPLIEYPDLTNLTVPTLASVVSNEASCNKLTWVGNCRVTINYNTHLHPIWTTNGCITCHTSDRTVLVNTVLVPVPPDGGLDLKTDSPAAVPPNYITYQALTELATPIPVTPGSASGSAFFANGRFDGGTHAGRLTGSQIKLIREWIDLGAQYSNTPVLLP
jgi:hypothetical protein